MMDQDKEIVGYILNGTEYCRKCGERASNKVKAKRLTQDEIITREDALGTQVYICDECGQSINEIALEEFLREK